MEIIEFILCCAVLLYWFAASIVGVCGVSFAIGMGGGKEWHYIFPFASIVLNVYCWSLLFQHSPFSIVINK